MQEQLPSPGLGLSNTKPKSETTLRLEMTTKEHQVQLLTLHKTPQQSRPVPENVVQTLPELCQAWGCSHCPGEPVSVSIHPPGEKPFPNNQPKPPAQRSMSLLQVLQLITRDHRSVPVPPFHLNIHNPNFICFTQSPQ